MLMAIAFYGKKTVTLTIDKIHEIAVPNGIIFCVEMIVIEREHPSNIFIVCTNQRHPTIVILCVQIKFFLGAHYIHVEVKLHRIRYLLKTPKRQNLECAHRHLVFDWITEEKLKGTSVRLSVLQSYRQILSTINMLEPDLITKPDSLISINLAAFEATDLNAG